MKYSLLVLLFISFFLNFGSTAYAYPSMGNNNCYSCHNGQMAPPVTPPAQPDHSTFGTNCAMCHTDWVFTNPVDDVPVVDDNPVDDNPVDDVPVVDVPVVDVPVVDDNPVDDNPVDDVPVVDDNPVDDNPVDDVPVVDDNPVDDNPVDDVPVVDDNPVDDNPDTECDPCKWTIPCESSNESNVPADRNIDANIAVNPWTHDVKIGTRGFVMVVVLGNKELSVKSIDTGSILFAGAKPVKFSLDHVPYKSAKKNFYLDMVLVFRRCDLMLDPNATEATLTGKTLSGVSFSGTGTVEVVDCRQ